MRNYLARKINGGVTLNEKPTIREFRFEPKKKKQYTLKKSQKSWMMFLHQIAET